MAILRRFQIPAQIPGVEHVLFDVAWWPCDQSPPWRSNLLFFSSAAPFSALLPLKLVGRITGTGDSVRLISPTAAATAVGQGQPHI